MHGEIQELGGGAIDEVFPKGHKHVPHISGCEVEAINRNGLRHHMAEVWALVERAMGVKKEVGGKWERVGNALSQHCEGLEQGWGEGQLLLTLDCIILEVGGKEACMDAMPIFKKVHMILGALGGVPTCIEWKVGGVGQGGTPMSTHILTTTLLLPPHMGTPPPIHTHLQCS